jgi:hypothetical protein
VVTEWYGVQKMRGGGLGKAAPALANWTLVEFGVSVLASVLAPAPAIG